MAHQMQSASGNHVSPELSLLHHLPQLTLQLSAVAVMLQVTGLSSPGCPCHNTACPRRYTSEAFPHLRCHRHSSFGVRGFNTLGRFGTQIACSSGLPLVTPPQRLQRCTAPFLEILEYRRTEWRKIMLLLSVSSARRVGLAVLPCLSERAWYVLLVCQAAAEL